MIKLLAFGVVSVVLFSAGQSDSVRDRLRELRQQARAQRMAGQNEARLSTNLAIEELLHHSARSLESTAAAYTSVGDKDRALAALERVAAMGEADDRLRKGSDTEFFPMHADPRYQAILERFTNNESSIARSVSLITISDPKLVTEDIDFDSATDTFLITSVLENKIVRVTKSGTITDFATSPSKWPMFALKIDAKRRRVWATEVALDNLNSVPKTSWGHSALLCFDLRTGKLLRRIKASLPAELGDMILLRNGLPIVSDGSGGGVYQLEGDHLRRLDHGDFISPQTPALLDDDFHILVPDYLRGIAVMDIRTGAVRWLNSDGAVPLALTGIDGLYRDGETLLLIQNGTTPERVSRISANAEFTALEAGDVIERNTPTLGDPTHGVVVGKGFYYLTNSGWDQLDDNGNPKPGGVLTSAHLMRFDLVARADPSTAEAPLIAPHTYEIAGGMVAGHQPDGNTYILESAEGVTVIDTGRHAEHLLKIEKFAADKHASITAIINSHQHLDHPCPMAPTSSPSPE